MTTPATPATEAGKALLDDRASLIVRYAYDTDDSIDEEKLEAAIIAIEAEAASAAKPVSGDHADLRALLHDAQSKHASAFMARTDKIAALLDSLDATNARADERDAAALHNAHLLDAANARAERAEAVVAAAKEAREAEGPPKREVAKWDRANLMPIEKLWIAVDALEGGRE